MLAAKGRNKSISTYDILSLEYQQLALKGLMRILGSSELSEQAGDEVLSCGDLLYACDVSKKLALGCEPSQVVPSPLVPDKKADELYLGRPASNLG